MFGISELAAWVCRYLPLRFSDSLCSSPFFSFRCRERRTSSETGRPLPAGKAGVRKRSSSASAVRREVPVSGNGIPGAWDTCSQPVGNTIPNARDTCSQPVGNSPAPSSRTDYRHSSRNHPVCFLMAGSRLADGVSALANPADGRE